MSSRLDKAIKDFIQIIREAGNKGTSPLDAQAEVLRIDEDGTAWVHLPGGVDETPVKLTINAEVGDKVYVRLSGGRAWITGNQTAPPTDDKTAIVAKSLANLAGNRAKTAQKTADKAQVVADSALKGTKENATQMAKMVLDFNGDIENLQDQIDGNIATWFYDVDPDMSLPPVTDWDTDKKKDAHLGDIYYNTVKGYAWRFMKSGSTYSWERITDTDVTKAIADAAKAQDTADSKRRVFYNTPTVPYDAGDLWVQGSGGDILRCAQAKTSTGSYDRNDWVLASKYTDDSALTTWIEGDFATTIQGLEEGLVDAKVETYYQTTDPSTGWSDTQKSEHKGDLWYNSTASVQKYYRWSGTAWQELTATPPQAVFDSIDKKATIYTGTTAPTNPSSGDLWLKGAEEPILTYVNNSWVEYNKYTDDSAALAAQSKADEAKAKAEAAQTAVSTKVETSVFNTLKNTVDENSANITSLTETVTTKADSSTVNALSNTVNEVKQTADANSSSISNLTTTVNSKADGSKVTALETKTSTIEQNLSGVTTRVTDLESENDGLDTRLTTAESKITDDAIVSTVTSSKTYKDALSGKVDTSVYNTKMEQLDNSISLKATATDVYTKTQADAAFDSKGSAATAKSEAISSAKSYTDTATTDMATEEFVTSQGYLTVTSDAITSKVSKNEVISAINQTAESVSINANKINLTGAVTFSSFDNSLQTTINNKAETSDLEGVRTVANNAAEVATNYLHYDDIDGLVLGNKESGSWVGYRTQIDTNSFNVLDENGNIIASYGSNEVELGKGNPSAIIKMCDGKAYVKNYIVGSQNTSVFCGQDVTVVGEWEGASEAYALFKQGFINIGQASSHIKFSNENGNMNQVEIQGQNITMRRVTNVGDFNCYMDANFHGNLIVQGDNLVSKIQAMLCTAYPETLTVKNGTFTNDGSNASLVGNNLYLHIIAKANAAITAGNITNQTMLTITFTDDRILTLYSVSGSGGSSGPNSQMLFTGASSGGQHTITVTLAAIAQNIAKGGVINAKVSIPCVLNWDAY